MKFYTTENKIFSGFIMALIVIGVFSWITYTNMKLTTADSKEVNTALQILKPVENVFISTLDMETGYSNFILTGKAHALDLFKNAIKTADTHLSNLLIVSQIDSTRKTDANHLSRLVNNLINYGKNAIEIRKEKGASTAIEFVNNDEGIVLMDQIRSVVNKIEERERKVLNRENAEKAERSHRTLILFVLMASVVFIFLLVSIAMIKNDWVTRQKANDQIAYLASLIEQTSDAIISTDKNRIIKSWNEGAEKMYGYTKEEAIGKNMVELLGSNLSDDQFNHFINNSEEKNFKQSEVIHKRKDGSQIHVSSFISVVKDSNGKPMGIVGVNIDITSQKKLEENLRKFNAELTQQVKAKTKEIDNIFDRISEGFILLDNNLVFIYVNKNASKFFQKSPGDIIGKSATEVFPNIINIPIYHETLKAISTGKPSEVENFSPLFQRWIHNHIYPSPEGVSIFFRDVTEERKNREELIASEEKYRMLVEQASDAIFISDQNGNYTDVNPSACKLLGYTKEELLSINSRDILYKENDVMQLPRRYEELKSGKSFISERKLKRKDGSPIDVETNGKMLPDGRFIGFVREITNRKQAEIELRQSEHKYKLLFNNNPIPMWMTSIPDLIFIDVNEAAVKHYGYSKEEFLSMNGKDIRPLQEVERYIKYNKQVKYDDIFYAGVWQHKKKNGDIINVEIIAQDIFYEGRAVRLVLANDVTEKLLAEEKLKQSHEELRNLASYLQKVREEERTNISREIHDELGQQLTALKMDAAWLNKKLADNPMVNEKLADMLSLADDTLKTVRRISADLRPVILDDIGLIAALEWQCHEFEKRTGIKCTFESSFTELDLNKEVAICIFRIYQESLTNAARHSKATHVITKVNKINDKMVLKIQDNGEGFELSSARAKKTLGIVGMQERAMMCRGEFKIESTKEEGTVITLIVPLALETNQVAI